MGVGGRATSTIYSGAGNSCSRSEGSRAAPADEAEHHPGQTQDQAPCTRGRERRILRHGRGMERGFHQRGVSHTVANPDAPADGETDRFREVRARTEASVRRQVHGMSIMVRVGHHGPGARRRTRRRPGHPGGGGRELDTRGRSRERECVLPLGGTERGCRPADPHPQRRPARRDRPAPASKSEAHPRPSQARRRPRRCTPGPRPPRRMGRGPRVRGTPRAPLFVVRPMVRSRRSNRPDS